MWSVYCLETVDKPYKTYIGATLDVNRRLRQHNGELSGGASATRGRVWNRVCHVRGFETERAALQFEWAWKYYSRKLNLKGSPIQRRLQSLLALLNCEKVTAKADPLSQSLTIVWESEKDAFDLLIQVL